MSHRIIEIFLDPKSPTVSIIRSGKEREYRPTLASRNRLLYLTSKATNLNLASESVNYIFLDKVFLHGQEIPF